MNISFNWLSEYVEHGLTPGALADLLTMVGLEVESVEERGQDLSGVVVGHVVATRAHPNADRLTLCDVDLGPEHNDGKPVQIVCGAPNVAPGQKVPVATVGTTLMLPSRKDPAVREPVTLGAVKLRGEASRGMICAEDELGLGTDHSGILVLDEGAEIGQPFADYLAARGRDAHDATLDVAITPNRPDAVSHLGIARDVAAVTGQPLRKPKVKLPHVGGDAAEAVSVEIEAPALCHRYVGMLVRGVTVGESPGWLKARLEAIGLRPRNNVVDVTNFVMYEAGQPLHAFDFEDIAAHTIIVKRTEGETTFTTLDDVERTLPDGTLMICDAKGPVAIAGVMGGEVSEVSETTRDVLIESAYFDPTSIRKTAKALGLQTDASYRFERGVDPRGQLWAAARAARLIAEIAGGEVVPGAVDAHPLKHEAREVLLRPKRLAHVLGAEVPVKEITRLLEAIGFEVGDPGVAGTMLGRALRRGVVEGEDVDPGLKVVVPSFRPDVEREIDVIEEVARLWGYDRVPVPSHLRLPYAPPKRGRAAEVLAEIRRRLVGLGFRELYTNSLLPTRTAEAFNAPELSGVAMEAVETVNAISREMAALRPSLLPGLLGAFAYNQNRDGGPLRFFELGHVFGRTPEGSSVPSGSVKGYHEHTSLAIGMSGPATLGGWDEAEREADFYDLKGVVEHLLRALGIEDVEEVADPEANERTAYRLFLEADGQRLGVLARTSDGLPRSGGALAEASDLRAPVFFAELNADVLAALVAARPPVRYVPISRHPAADRDLAVAVDRGAAVRPMLRTIREAAGELLRDVRVFDLYAGDRIGAGKKSVAFALRFGAERTLTDEVVDERVRAVVRALEREHGAELRQ